MTIDFLAKIIAYWILLLMMFFYTLYLVIAPFFPIDKFGFLILLAFITVTLYINRNQILNLLYRTGEDSAIYIDYVMLITYLIMIYVYNVGFLYEIEYK